MHKRFATECPGAFFLDANNVASLTAYLQERGILPQQDIVLHLAKAGEGNMNLTLRVEASSGRFIIKQSRPWVEKYPQLAAPWDRVLQEAAFYQLIADIPAIAEKMPRLLTVDADSRIIFLEDLGEAGDFSTLYSGERLSPEDLGRLAGYLSALHRLAFEADTRATLTNRELRQLNHAHIFDIPLQAENGLDLDTITPGLARAANGLKNDAAFVRQTTALGQYYLSDGPTLLHGDFYPGSWLHSEAGLRVIDPEFGHFGCAEFELGVLRAHFILSGHSEAHWETFWRSYHSSSTFQESLMNQFAGVEIMRRIMGYAQLPLAADLAQKEAWLSRSRELVLH